MAIGPSSPAAPSGVQLAGDEQFVLRLLADARAVSAQPQLAITVVAEIYLEGKTLGDLLLLHPGIIGTEGFASVVVARGIDQLRRHLLTHRAFQEWSALVIRQHSFQMGRMAGGSLQDDLQLLQSYAYGSLELERLLAHDEFDLRRRLCVAMRYFSDWLRNDFPYYSEIWDQMSASLVGPLPRNILRAHELCEAFFGGSIREVKSNHPSAAQLSEYARQLRERRWSEARHALADVDSHVASCHICSWRLLLSDLWGSDERISDNIQPERGNESSPKESPWGMGVLPTTHQTVEGILQDSDTDARVKTIRALGQAAYDAAEDARKDGNLDDAILQVKRGLAAFRIAGGDDRSVADGLHALGLLERERGELKDAEPELEAALEAYKNISDRQWLSIAHHSLGELLRLQGKFDDARVHFHDALSISEDPPERMGQMVSRLSLGMLEFEAGNYGGARELLENAIVDLNAVIDAEAPGVRHHEGGTARLYLDAMGASPNILLDGDAFAEVDKALRLCLFEDAVKAWYADLPRSWGIRVQLLLARVRLTCWTADHDSKHLERVMELTAEARKRASRLRNPALEADALAYEALACLHAGRREDAEEYGRLSSVLYERLGITTPLAREIRGLGSEVPQAVLRVADQSEAISLE